VRKGYQVRSRESRASATCVARLNHPPGRRQRKNRARPASHLQQADRSPWLPTAAEGSLTRWTAWRRLPT
jgi:hypothetical protein